LLQAKLLRIIQEKEVERLGGLHPVKVDVRVIVATNKNLNEEVKKGSFREDLYYRLNVVRIWVPPLRERKEDIPPLMDFFAKRYTGRYKKNIKGFTRESRDQLIKYDYPGNVRELENMIERAIVLARSDYITLDDIPNLSESTTISSEGGIRETVGVMEKQMITEALIKADWVQTKAAALLGISERMLRYKMKKYAISRE